MLKLIVFLWGIYKKISSKKGVLNKIIKANIVLYFIKFLELVRKIGFRKTIKFLYYSMSAFNFIVATLVILAFTEINWGGINYNLIEIVYNSLILLIPIFLMEIITENLGDYILNMVDYFKNLIRKFIDWATEPRKPNIKLPNKRNLDYLSLDYLTHF